GIFVLAENTTIQGNLIGLDPTGAVALGNAFNGVELHGATNTLIGGADPAARNVISGNAGSGVFVTGSGSGKRVQGNYAGTDVTGIHAHAHGIHGMAIRGAAGVPVGGSASGAVNPQSRNPV